MSNNEIQLMLDIENLRKRLLDVGGIDLQKPDLIELSQQMDKLIVRSTRNNLRKINNN